MVWAQGLCGHYSEAAAGCGPEDASCEILFFADSFSYSSHTYYVFIDAVLLLLPRISRKIIMMDDDSP